MKVHGHQRLNLTTPNHKYFRCYRAWQQPIHFDQGSAFQRKGVGNLFGKQAVLNPGGCARKQEYLA